MINLKGLIGFTVTMTMMANMVVYWAWFMK